MKKKRDYIPRNRGISKAVMIMKLSFIFTFVLLLNASAGLYSQKQKFNIAVRDAKLVDVLSKIEKESDISFYYKSEDIDHSKTYSVNYKDEELVEILDDLLQNSNLTFKMMENFVAIMKTNAETSTVAQQQKTVSGVITDKNGEPLPGVSVYIKGTTQGTITSIDGKYTINTSDETAILVFSFIGFETQEVAVTERTTINITLMDETTDLGEVVVTGYGQISKEAFTGSSVIVNSQKIESRPVASFQDVLRGNSPGTLVSGTGQPGAMSTVRLRGIGSMNASNAPLYVVDGVIFDVSNISGSSDYAMNPLNTLNPSDIESMNILKDAASSSLYGSRGANGVIVITTKSGKKDQKTKYSLDVQAGVSKIFNASKPDLVNKDEFMELWLEGEMHYQIRRKTGFENFFTEIQNIYADKEGYVVSGRNYNDWMNYAKDQFNNHFYWYDSKGDIIGYDRTNEKYFFNSDGTPGEHYNMLPDVNWYDEVTQIAPFQKFNLSMQGGSKSIRYYNSLEYFNQQGVIIGSELKRYSLRSKVSNETEGAFVHWGINSLLSYTNQEGPRSNGYGYAMPQYTALAIAPISPVYLEDGSYNFRLPKGVNGNMNPVAIQSMNELRNPQTKILLSGYAQLNFTDWLNFKSSVSLDYSQARRRQWYNREIGDGKSVNGGLYERDAHRRKIINTNLLNFSFKLDDQNKFNGYVGSEIEDMRYTYIEARGTNFATNDAPYLSASASPDYMNGSGSTYGMVSYMSQLNYVFNDQLYLSGSYRLDQSSRFAKEHRKGNFWSLSGAYRLKSLPFFDSAAWLNKLKVKMSYGTSGILPGSYYAWQSLYDYGAAYNNTPGVSPGSIANPDITWEQNKNLNIALETRIFDRVSINLEWYKRNSEDLLQDLPLSYLTGHSSKLINTSATLENTGIELSIDADIIRSSDFTWNLSFNMATLKNKINGLEDDIIGGTQIQRNGESMYTWFMPEYAGIDPENGRMQWYYMDENGNNAKTYKFDEAEKRLSGIGLPKINGGFTSTFIYKNLELSALFTYGTGHKVMDYTGRTATKNDGYRDYRSIERSQLARWTPDNPNGTEPIRINSSGSWDRYLSTRYLHDGDYLKLKNIRLQYTLGNQIVKKLKLSGVSLFAQAENLWVLTDLDGFDPEISLSGYRDADQYPTATTFTGGVKVNF